MKFKIVSDSSCDIDSLEGVAFEKAAMKISTDERQYTDDDSLDIPTMLAELAAYKGRSYTSCPNIDEWLNAFADAENIFAVTITSGLSGSYNAATAAKQLCGETHPEKNIFIIDTLSAGPEMAMIIKKLEELILSGLSFDETALRITDYMKHTHLLFALASYHNFIQNGRVNKLAATAAGKLGIRIIGVASEEGKLELVSKHKGQVKTVVGLVKEMVLRGFKGGKVFIGHTLNEEGAELLKSTVLKYYPQADMTFYPMRGLCSYYAETGGLLMAFEDGEA